MASGRRSETADYISDNRLTVDLADAHRKSVADLGHDFSEEHQSIAILRGISQGFAHEIHDVISAVLPSVNMLNVHRVHVEEMMEFPDIKKIEGSMFQKVVILAVMTDAIADAVADVIWKRKTGTDITEALDTAMAIGEEEQKRVHDEYDAIYRKAKEDFGL